MSFLSLGILLCRDTFASCIGLLLLLVCIGTVARAAPVSARAVAVYDDSGRQLRTGFSEGTCPEPTYDALGRKVNSRDQDGHTTRYAYDADGRLTGVTDPLASLEKLMEVNE